MEEDGGAVVLEVAVAARVLFAPVLGIAQNEKSRAAQSCVALLGQLLMLGAVHLLHGLQQVTLDVIAVMRDGSLRKHILDGALKRSASSATAARPTAPTPCARHAPDSETAAADTQSTSGTPCSPGAASAAARGGHAPRRRLGTADRTPPHR